MMIFIDESGGFQPVDRSPAVSCVAALVVPENFAPTLFRRFRKLLRSFQSEKNQEVKGSKLSEAQMAAVIRLLLRFEVLVFVMCVDLGLQSAEGITEHKKLQAEIFRKKVSSTMFPDVREYLSSLATRTEGTSNQLWLQATALTKLVNRVLHYSTLYYVQRLPQTLGRFKWRVDAKDQTVTNYEKLWSDLVLPFSQTESLLEPLEQLEGGDYSAFSRFERSEPEIPNHLRPALPGHEGPFAYLDVEEIMRDLRFVQSHRLTGLQIIDVVASAIRRACNGTLRREGWLHIGRLMPRMAKGRGKAVQFLVLGEERPSSGPHPSYSFVKECDREARDPLTAFTRRP